MGNGLGPSQFHFFVLRAKDSGSDLLTEGLRSNVPVTYKLLALFSGQSLVSVLCMSGLDPEGWLKVASLPGLTPIVNMSLTLSLLLKVKLCSLGKLEDM